MKAYWGSGCIAPRIFLTSALDEGEWSASRPGLAGPQSLSERGGEERNTTTIL